MRMRNGAHRHRTAKIAAMRSSRIHTYHFLKVLYSCMGIDNSNLTYLSLMLTTKERERRSTHKWTSSTHAKAGVRIILTPAWLIAHPRPSSSGSVTFEGAISDEMDNIPYCALIPDGNGLVTFRYVPQPSSCLKCRVLQLAFCRHISRISVSIYGFRSLNSCVLRKNLPAEELLVTLRPNTRRPVLRRLCCRNFRLQEAKNNLTLIIERRIFIKRFVYFNNVATAVLPEN